MTQRMYKKEEIAQMIISGKSLVLAADEKVLSAMPKGNWIGGTIPYFIGENGGLFSQDMIFVTEVPDYATLAEIKVYNSETISEIYKDAKDTGFSLVIISGFSNTHSVFALNAPSFDNFGFSPLIGWISGFDLRQTDASAKVIDGRTLNIIDDGAVVFHIQLPKNKIVDIQIVNIFEQGQGDSIKFVKDGFDAKDSIINGKRMNFADYIANNKINVQLPLVADMYGALINTSFQYIDEENKIVHFYAPVFKGVEYKIGNPIEDYLKEFLSKLPSGIDDKIYFSCNCILNYIYADLEGKKTGSATGPITFGEIAYQLLNQTMTYITIDNA